jgi:hypothetical protein
VGTLATLDRRAGRLASAGGAKAVIAGKCDVREEDRRDGERRLLFGALPVLEPLQSLFDSTKDIAAPTMSPIAGRE